jgi:hypothetical protein
MIETVYQKASPRPTGFMWPFRNGDNWSAPDYNNGAPYLPNVKAKWLRNFYWYCRNPLGNFMGFVIGVEGRDYSATGPAPVMLTTWYDATPPAYGFKWAVIRSGWLVLPFASYSGKKFLWYWGWRPYSGGHGFKFVIHKTAN